MTAHDTRFALTDVRVRFAQLLDEIENATPDVVLERLHKAEAIVAKTREYLDAMPRCDQEGCSALATHGTTWGYGRRCKEHADKGWHSYVRAKVQGELVAMLASEERS